MPYKEDKAFLDKIKEKTKPNTRFRYFDYAEGRWYTGRPLFKSTLVGIILGITFSLPFLIPLIDHLLKTGRFCG